MALCPHCGESMADGQENCYACGQHVRTRAYRHEHRANPIVLIAAGLVVVAVLGVLLLMRANATRKQAALVAEAETLRAQDSARRASHQWQDMVQVAENDAEARSVNADLNDIESRFESVRLRVAANPTPPQDSIIDRVGVELELLRHSVVVLASALDTEKQMMRDSIQAGERRVEDLTKELGGTE